MKFEEMNAIVALCEYKPDWKLLCMFDPASDRAYVQVSAVTTDSLTFKPAKWTGAKHWLSEHMCRQEIVGVCFQAIKQAEEHELREFFRYRGVQIYNPHIDPDALVTVAGQINARQNPMQVV